MRNSATEVYVELRLTVEVAEKSWGSSDPVEDIVKGVVDNLHDKVFDSDRLENILRNLGYNVTDIEHEEVDDWTIYKNGNEADTSIVEGFSVSIEESITEKEAEEIASAIYKKFKFKDKKYSLVGIPIEGIPLRSSDLDNPYAEIECRFPAMSISSNGKNLYFD